MQFAATTLFPTFNAIHRTVADISGTLLLRRKPILNPRRVKVFACFFQAFSWQNLQNVWRRKENLWNVCKDLNL